MRGPKRRQEHPELPERGVWLAAGGGDFAVLIGEHAVLGEEPAHLAQRADGIRQVDEQEPAVDEVEAGGRQAGGHRAGFDEPAIREAASGGERSGLLDLRGTEIDADDFSLGSDELGRASR